MKRIISFRTFEESDIDSFYRWRNDEDLTRMTVGLCRRISKEEITKWVISKIPHNPYEVYWAVCTNDEEKRLIGYVSLSSIHYINSSAQFGGILIGDPKYQGGVAWIQIYQFVLEYVFERLGLNRLGGRAITEHPQTLSMMKALFFEKEGVEREAVYKNGRYYDVQTHALLKRDYFAHKNNGEYEFSSILKRIAEHSLDKGNDGEASSK